VDDKSAQGLSQAQCSAVHCTAVKTLKNWEWRRLRAAAWPAAASVVVGADFR
jgi:DNA-binding transcriptional regulator YiaG